MKLFDNIKMNNVISELKLCIAKCTNGNIMLYVGNGKGKIMLRRFSGYKSYERFLVRSVVLSLLLNGGYDKDVDRCYKNLLKTLETLPEFHSDKLGE